MNRATLAAALTAATAVLAPSPAVAAEDPLGGETLHTSTTWGIYTLDATCHFGPRDDSSLETRLYVQGWATAPGAVRTTIRCTVESGNGIWNDVHEATTPGPASAVASDQHLWWSDYDRVCVSASAEIVGVDTFVAPTVCATP